jgi:hypothetical protein
MNSDRSNNESPAVSPENRLNVVPYLTMHRNTFIRTLDAALGSGVFLKDALQIEHDVRSRTRYRYVLYRVPKTVGDVLHDRFLFQDTNEFDMDWFRESVSYTKGLNFADLFVLKSYTKYGDEIVNNYLRDPVGFLTNRRVSDLMFIVMPTNQHLCFAIQLLQYHFRDHENISRVISNFITNNGELIGTEFGDLLDIWNDYEYDEAAIKEIVESYIDDMKRIIRNAPKPTRPMRVFRGAQRDYLRNAVNAAVHSQGFTSTTMNPEAIFNFHGRKNVFEMIINPNVSCVVTEDITYFPHEYEVLISSDTLVMPSQKKEKFMLNQHDGYGLYDESFVYDPKGKTDTLYSRRVVVCDDAVAQEGGFSPKKMSTVLRGRSVTRKSGKTKMRGTRRGISISKGNGKGSKRAQYTRPNLDPTLVKGPPVSKKVEDYMRSLMEEFH